MSDEDRSQQGQSPPASPAPPDPRLEIPEILRSPMDHPAARRLREGRSAAHAGSGGLGDAAKALAIGLDFLISAAAGGFAGWLIDHWLGSSPTGVVVGLGVGFVAGTVRLIQRLNRA
jgi:F0F1-type ATP synthase assembly protein I